MKKLFILIFLFVFASSFSKIQAQKFDKFATDGKLYVKLKNNAQKIKTKSGIVDIDKAFFLDNEIKRYAISKISKPFYNIKDSVLDLVYLIEFNEYSNVDDFVADLKLNKDIDYVEKSPIFYTSSIKDTPNDLFYGVDANSWFLDLISADQAWDITTGSSDVVVAVVDDAIQIDHPDLAANIIGSYDVANDDDDPRPIDVNTFSHGTHCAGLVAAQTNNSIGIASIGRNLKILAVKAASDDNPDGISAGYAGIIYAVQNGADIISLSWGGSTASLIFQDVINYAVSQGCLVVAAAGNEGLEGNFKSYPACYDNVISVGAVNEDDSFASFSQNGDDRVDVCAPGGTSERGNGLLSTVPYFVAKYNGNYDTKSGTSMATPITAGLCGLMLSVNPDLTPEKLTQLLYASCDDISSQNLTKGTGHGRINAYKAVQSALNSVEDIVADFSMSTTNLYTGSQVSFSNKSSVTATSWNWTFEGGTPSTSTEENPVIVYNSEGKFYAKLVVSDGIHSSTEIKYDVVNVSRLGFGIVQATRFRMPTRGIEKISIIDENKVWAFAFDGADPKNTVYDYTRTVDGGLNWEADTFPSVEGLKFSDMCAVSQDVAWLSFFDDNDNNSGGAIYKTIDGGANWVDQTTAEYSGADAFTNTVYFFDENNGWSMGDPNNGYFEIYTTSDGGDNWTRVPQANIPANLTGEYGTVGLRDGFGESTAWFSTNKGRVFKTVDKGATWTVSSTELGAISDISFADGENGVVTNISINDTEDAITDIQFSITSDGGSTWKSPVSIKTVSGFYSKIKSIPSLPGTFISIGKNLSGNYGSSYSVDYGNKWFNIDDNQYTDVEFYNEDVGWAGSYNESATVGGIIKWASVFTAIKDLNNEKFAGIFPNPTSGMVNIHANTSFKGNISINLYDITGAKVYSKVERNLSSEVFSTTLDLSGFKSGVYFTILRAGNDVFRNKIILE